MSKRSRTFGIFLLALSVLISGACEAAGSKSKKKHLILQDDEIQVLLIRELTQSFDETTGSKQKGLCGLNNEGLGQVLRALHSESDAHPISDSQSDKILKRHKKCGPACRRALCKSELFKKIEAEKEKYGSAADGV